MLFEDDFGVGGHVGLELAAGVVDGDADFKCRDVVFFDAEGAIFVTLPLNVLSLKDSTLMRAGWPM